MYQIKEFSKITGLPTSTLRYYDKENILNPSLRNNENNYRYYTEDDYKKAILLFNLRENNFSIAEMKDILMTISDFNDISYYLIEKRNDLNKK